MTKRVVPLTYAAAGVDIGRATEAVRLIGPHVKRTHDATVLGGIGPFAAAVDLSQILSNLEIVHPIMLQSVDGPGTIPILARLASDGVSFSAFRTLGYNVAIHCFCDLACGGGKPITLLDNISCTDMHPGIIEAIVAGMCNASEEVGCRVVGGEMAQLPKVVVDGEYDFCACVTGLVEKDKWIQPLENIRPGQLLVGFEAHCPNLNGISLVRKIVFEKLGMGIHEIIPATGLSVADTFIQHQPNYSRVITMLLDNGHKVIGASHITGGGLVDNIERNLPEGCEARFIMWHWPKPRLYDWLIEQGRVNPDEACKTWNMGIGFVQVVADLQEAEMVIRNVHKMLGIGAWVVGRVSRCEGRGRVSFSWNPEDHTT